LTIDEVVKAFPSRKFREYQKETLTKMVEAFNTGTKCIILASPTGSGKSYLNTAFTSLTRSFYATPQLALIDQIKRDPNLDGRFVEIKGRSNYRCFYKPDRGVHVGKCETEGYACTERFQVCPYWMQKIQAMNAPSVLTSLAYLIGEGQTEGVSETYLGSRTLMVLDESHNIEEQCLSQISLRVTPFTIPHELYSQFLPRLRKVKEKYQVDELLDYLVQKLVETRNRIERVEAAGGLSVSMADEKSIIDRFIVNYKLYHSSTSEWVWQVRNDQLLLQPIFAKEFMQNLLWKRASYYIISSATILYPKEFIRLSGLSDFLSEDQILFLQTPSTFPVENRPIIDATVGLLSQSEWSKNIQPAVTAVENILRRERGNVAIHCHSYVHQRAIMNYISEDLKPRLIVHGSGNREEKLKEWMQSHGKVFVSVAFNEGQDWKYEVCDCQILFKVPFPDLGDVRVRRRLDSGYRTWYQNQAMLAVIQAYGRAIRAEDDKARFYIIDGSFKRLAQECWAFIPDWFKEALPTTFQKITYAPQNTAANP
jgi:Rad3-related DNA helicase